MKQKLLFYFALVKPYLSKVYTYSPFPLGVACGYFGSPLIKLAIRAVRMALGLV